MKKLTKRHGIIGVYVLMLEKEKIIRTKGGDFQASEVMCQFIKDLEILSKDLNK